MRRGRKGVRSVQRLATISPRLSHRDCPILRSRVFLRAVTKGSGYEARP
jgi:hypothetical protein